MKKLFLLFLIGLSFNHALYGSLSSYFCRAVRNHVISIPMALTGALCISSVISVVDLSKTYECKNFLINMTDNHFQQFYAEMFGPNPTRLQRRLLKNYKWTEEQRQNVNCARPAFNAILLNSNIASLAFFALEGSASLFYAMPFLTYLAMLFYPKYSK